LESDLKKALDNLFSAYELIKQRQEELPEEYRFLLDPEFQEELGSIKTDAEKILTTTQMVGDQIGEESVDKETVEETVEYLREIGLLSTKEEPKKDEQEEADEGTEDRESAPAKEPKKDTAGKDKKDDKEIDKVKRVKSRALRIIETILDHDD